MGTARAMPRTSSNGGAATESSERAERLGAETKIAARNDRNRALGSPSGADSLWTLVLEKNLWKTKVGLPFGIHRARTCPLAKIGPSLAPTNDTLVDVLVRGFAELTFR